MCTNIAKDRVTHPEKKDMETSYILGNNIYGKQYMGNNHQKRDYSRKATACEHHNCMFVATINLRTLVFLTEAYNFGHRTDKKLVNYSLLHPEKKQQQQRHPPHQLAAPVR